MRAREKRLARVKLIKARVESADIKRRMREARMKDMKLRRFAAEKKQKEIEAKYHDSTVRKASSFAERLRNRSAMRSQRRRDMAKQMAMKAAMDVKRRGLEVSRFTRILRTCSTNLWIHLNLRRRSHLNQFPLSCSQ